MENSTAISPALVQEIITNLRKSIFFLRQKNYHPKHLSIIMPDWLKVELGLEELHFYGVKIASGTADDIIVINNDKDSPARERQISHSIQLNKSGLVYKTD